MEKTGFLILYHGLEVSNTLTADCEGRTYIIL